MTLFNVFDTEEAAIAALDNDNKLYFKDAKDTEITLSWDIVQKRNTDNKWVYRVCPNGSSDHVKEEFSNDWFTSTDSMSIDSNTN